MADLETNKKNMILWRLYKDQNAATELIASYKGFVIMFVRRYLGQGLSFEELESAGMLGLLNAIDKFDYDNNDMHAFTTYAGLAIERTIQRELKNYKKHSHVLSFTETIGNSNDGDDLTVEDIIGTDEEELFEEVISNIKNDVVRNALKSLTIKEQKIILLKYGLDETNSKSLTEIAELFKCSTQNIYNIEKKALTKMRHPRNTRKLKDFIDE